MQRPSRGRHAIGSWRVVDTTTAADDKSPQKGTATRIREAVSQVTTLADNVAVIVGSTEHPNPTETWETVAPKDSGRLSILRNKFTVSSDTAPRREPTLEELWRWGLAVPPFVHHLPCPHEPRSACSRY
jgi:hypothetical protein